MTPESTAPRARGQVFGASRSADGRGPRSPPVGRKHSAALAPIRGSARGALTGICESVWTSWESVGTSWESVGTSWESVGTSWESVETTCEPVGDEL